jgi:hypothetical protein
MSEHVARMGKIRNRTNTVRKSRCTWEDNIRMDLSEIGWEDMDWMNPEKDRDQWRTLVNTVMNLRVP